MRNKLFITAITLVYTGLQMYAQGDLLQEKQIFLRDERTFGAFLTSNGIGLDFSYGKRLSARNQVLYQASFMNLKHPKEISLSSGYFTGRTFVFGKANSFWELKGQYGYMSEIYRKNDAGGLSIRYFIAGGPTIGITKPIYYDVRYYIQGQVPYYLKSEKFSPTIHQSNIDGKSSFFKGFDELGVIPGVSGKFGFTFEYSRNPSSISAIEIGTGVDLFVKRVPIMAIETNEFMFINLFAGYRFGKNIDISEAARAKSPKERRKEQKLSRSIVKEQKKAARLQESE